MILTGSVVISAWLSPVAYQPMHDPGIVANFLVAQTLSATGFGNYSYLIKSWSSDNCACVLNNFNYNELDP